MTATTTTGRQVAIAITGTITISVKTTGMTKTTIGTIRTRKIGRMGSIVEDAGVEGTLLETDRIRVTLAGVEVCRIEAEAAIEVGEEVKVVAA